MCKVYIQFCSILATLISSLFLLKGSIGLSPKAIAELSSMKYRYNSDLVHTFSHQSVDTKIGVSLLILSFLLQLLQSFYPVSDSSQLKNLKIILYALFSAIIVYISAYIFADHMANNLAKEVLEMFKE